MAVASGSTSNYFHNGDGCGDIIYMHNKNMLQIINSISNIFHVIAGLRIIYRARSNNIQTSGLCLIITAIFSFVYHSTSKSSGFILDVLGMVIWGTSLVYNGLSLLSFSDFRCKVISTMGGVYIVSCIHYLMELDFTPIRVWYIWSFHFTLLMIVSSIIPIYIGFMNNMINMHYIKQIILALFMIGIGVLWTQLIHVFCDKTTLNVNYFFPFHSLWHLFAAIAGYLMMSLLDEVNIVVKRNSYKKDDSFRIV